MLFQHTLRQVLEGRKTQTRRIAKSNECPVLANGQIHAVEQSGRIKWQVGRTYAIQPKRGSKQIGRFRLLSIRHEQVQNISHEDATREGFPTREAFFGTWHDLHGINSDHELVWVLEFEVTEVQVDALL